MKTHRDNFYRKHNIDSDKSLSLPEISNLSDVPLSILKEVFQRGRNAWSHDIQSVREIATGKKYTDVPRSQKMSANQWAYARVYSFLDKGKTFHTADSDLAKRIPSY